MGVYAGGAGGPAGVCTAQAVGLGMRPAKATTGPACTKAGVEEAVEAVDADLVLAEPEAHPAC